MDAFLSDVRIAIREKRCIFDSRKEKNRNTLAALALTIDDMYKEVLSLTCEDYCYGPVPDNRPGRNEFVWIFKKKVDWLTIYIKLEFIHTPTKRLAVLSFHEDNAT